MARNIYHVVSVGPNWAVKHTGVVLSRHTLKSAAVESGRTVARGSQPSQLIVHRADGSIEEESTYGQDPFPPRG